MLVQQLMLLLESKYPLLDLDKFPLFTKWRFGNKKGSEPLFVIQFLICGAGEVTMENILSQDLLNGG